MCLVSNSSSGIGIMAKDWISLRVCLFSKKEANPSSTCLLNYDYEDHPLKNYINELRTTYSSMYSGLWDRFWSQTQYDENPDCFK